MPRILILAPFAPAYLKRLGRHFDVLHESWLDSGTLLDPQELGERLATERIDFLVIEADFVLAETLAAAPNLRFVGVCRSQVGPHVDLAAAAERGVTVVHTPGRNATAVAELTLGLILALARRIPQADATVRAGRWERAYDGYATWGGMELAGRTAGLIGLGHVGQAVARRLLAFEMRVLAYDPFLTGRPDPGIDLCDLATLLQQADVVTIHCALTPQTRGLIDGHALALLRPHAYLVNTARAAVVDEAALLAALAEKRLAGAALDVHRVEPLPPNSPFLALDNVLLTPHMGGGTTDVVMHHSRMMTEAIEAYLAQEGENE